MLSAQVLSVCADDRGRVRAQLRREFVGSVCEAAEGVIELQAAPYVFCKPAAQCRFLVGCDVM